MPTPLHEWKLDETSGLLLDTGSSASPKSGTATGTVVIPGLFGNARKYTANADRILIDFLTDFTFGTAVGTWVIRFRAPTVTNGQERMLLTKRDSGDQSFVVGLTGYSVDKLYASFYGTPASKTVYGDKCQDGLIHTMAVTFNPPTQTYKMFMDGVLTGSITDGPSVMTAAATKKICIGNYTASWDQSWFFTGGQDTGIDTVQLYDTVLSDADIEKLTYTIPSSLVITNQVPPPSATGVARDTNIQLSFVATGGNTQLSTIDLWVKGAPAYDGATDAFIAPYNGPASARTGTPAQYDFVIDPVTDFDYDETVSVRAYGQDDIGHTVDQTWSFGVTQDVTAPAVDNRNPAPAQINVRWKSDVYLEIYETETLVQRNTIKVYVGGTLAFDGATGFQTGFTGSVLPADATAARYYVTVNPSTNFGFSTVVTTRVVARNTSVPYEELDTSYNFTTEAKSISLTDRDPAPSETGVRTVKSPVVAVQDSSYNIVPTGVNIYVDGHLAYDGTAFQPGYDGPASARTGTPAKYTYTIDPTNDFAFIDTIPIRVVAVNDDDQPLDETYSFTTKGMVYYDKGAGGNIFYVDPVSAIALTGVGLVYIRDPLTPYIDDLQLPNGQLTIEARVIPALSATVSYLLTGAEMVLGFNHAGKGFWSYVAKGQTNTFVHERLVGLHSGVDNYLALRHVFGSAASTAMVINGTQIVGRWYGSFPAQVAGTGAITAYANIGGGIVRVTSNGHGMATGTWIRINGTTNYNDVFQIANAQPNTFDITATWAGDDGVGTWDKTNNDHNLAGWTKPAFAVGDYSVALGHDDVLVMLGMNSVAKTVLDLIAYAKGRL